MNTYDLRYLVRMNELNKSLKELVFYEFFSRHNQTIDINELEIHGFKTILNSAGMVAKIYEETLKLDKINNAKEIEDNFHCIINHAHKVDDTITRIFKEDLGFQNSDWYHEKIHRILVELQDGARYIINHRENDHRQNKRQRIN